jgi:uracil-DNA glycosylase
MASTAENKHDENEQDWHDVLLENKAVFDEVISKMEKLGPYYPKEANVLAALRLCPLETIKVVILGQDPYPGTNSGSPVANGIAFSTNKGVPVQASLKNIYKEIQQEYPSFKIPDHGDLTKWCNQGVLLLNTALTYHPSQKEAALSQGLWLPIIDILLKTALKKNSECIFVCWGNHAKNFVSKYVKGAKNILTAAHPSPLSAHKGFFGCKHFTKINELLSKQSKTAIDWSI